MQVGFFLFSKHNREDIKKGLPAGAAVTEVAKALGVAWKKLPEVRNAPWHQPILLCYAALHAPLALDARPRFPSSSSPAVISRR